MTKLRLVRIFWIGAAAILIAAALVALVAVLRGDFSDTDGRILGSLAVLLYTGGAALSGLALVDRRRASWLGWVVVAASPVTLVLTLRAVWELGDDGGDDDWVWQSAWSAVVALVAGLVASTSLLLARRERMVRLAWAAGALAVTAAVLSIAAIWSEGSGEGLAKLLAALWIVAALAYFLVPVLERFLAPPATGSAQRVLASFDDVELVATRSREGIEPRLAPGERLLLRRRA